MCIKQRFLPQEMLCPKEPVFLQETCGAAVLSLIRTATLERAERRKELVRPLKSQEKNLKMAQWLVHWAMRLRRHAIIRGLRIARRITVL